MRASTLAACLVGVLAGGLAGEAWAGEPGTPFTLGKVTLASDSSKVLSQKAGKPRTGRNASSSTAR